MSKQIQVTTDDATQLAEIKEQQSFVDDLAAKVGSCKDALKEAKDEWEAAVERLGCIIRDDEERPLLDGGDDD